MTPSQNPPGEEQILLTVADQSKLDLVMELLSHFDLVRAERIRSLALVPQSPPDAESDFWAMAGLWADRDVDAQTLRQQAWQRADGAQL
ncbi:MAG TPA: hypothetical protein VF629_23620 [Hymenobacter sp.]|jgi:hypothetical protein|uniref:hypothetical protein n=1 Tax=Hymenobacter sp. TaxID=1898978 RepID=UPI002EDBAFA3